jgi:hypothetical protein
VPEKSSASLRLHLLHIVPPWSVVRKDAGAGAARSERVDSPNDTTPYGHRQPQVRPPLPIFITEPEHIKKSHCEVLLDNVKSGHHASVLSNMISNFGSTCTVLLNSVMFQSGGIHSCHLCISLKSYLFTIIMNE